MERTIFFHPASGTYLVADAYRGREIKRAIVDFCNLAAGRTGETIEVHLKPATNNLRLPATTALCVYVGHDGLMDFSIEDDFRSAGKERREVMILACASKAFLAPKLRNTGADPILWTTGLMAPEAYTLKAALDGWTARESHEQIRQRAALAYAHYQKCSIAAAQGLFSPTW